MRRAQRDTTSLPAAAAAALSQRYCGSINFSAARQMLDGGYAANANKCVKLLNAIGR